MNASPADPFEECLDPRPTAHPQPLAQRPTGAGTRKLVFFDNGKLSAPYIRWTPVVAPLVAHLRTMGEVSQEYADLLLEPVAHHAQYIARWRQQNVDGVVFGLCDAGVVGPTLLFAAATEAAGIAAVVLCTDQVMDLAATGAAFQAPGLPIVLLPAGRLDTPAQLAAAAQRIAPEVQHGLCTDAATLLREFAVRFPDANDLAPQPNERVPAAAEFPAFAQEHHMTDGLPVVAPTRSRVKRFIDAAQRDPNEVLIESLSPSGAPLTVEKVAACAAMAGAQPAVFPFVLAALEAMATPDYQVHLAAITTHPGGNLILFSGPAADAVGITSGRGCLGPGQRSNVTIGRAVAFTLLNVGRAVPGLSTLSLLGSPAQLTCCFADAPNAPLPRLHTTLGNGHDTIAWALKCESPHNVMDHVSSTPESLLGSFCAVAATAGGNNAYIPGDLLLILNPEHADIVARAGWSREDVRRFVWENARNDRAALQGRGSKPEWPAQWQDLDRLPVVPSPDRIWTVVAGAPGPQSMVVIPWGYAKAAWRPVASA